MKGIDRLRRTLLVAGMVMSSLPGLAQEDETDSVKPEQDAAQTAQDKKPGLKFKRGPTCMCAHGTSEEEIRRAEEERRRATEQQQQE